MLPEKKQKVGRELTQEPDAKKVASAATLLAREMPAAFVSPGRVQRHLQKHIHELSFVRLKIGYQAPLIPKY